MNKLAAIDIGSSFGSPFSDGSKNFGNLVTLGLNTSLAVAAVIIMFLLVIAGFNLIKGAGSGNQQEAQKAKQAATSAVIGFVIIFTAYWIVRIIEVLTGVDFLTAPGF